MIIIVSGLPGSGKSVLVEKLAKQYKLKKIFASDILKQLQGNKDKKVDTKHTEKSSGWWETDEGQKFNMERLKDKEFDKALDDKLLGIVEKEDNIIMDSRTMPWLSKKEGLIKIWITASPNVRAQRVAQRDKSDWKKALQTMEQRLEVDKIIYKKLYKIAFSEDLMPFQLRLDTTNMDEQEVFQEVVQKIDELSGKTPPKPEPGEEKKEEETTEEKAEETTEEQKEEEPVEEEKEGGIVEKGIKEEPEQVSEEKGEEPVGEKKEVVEEEKKEEPVEEKQEETNEEKKKEELEEI